VKQKPRVVEEHDSFSAIISTVEAGTGVAIGADTLGHSFGNRVKVLHITPEPKPISVVSSEQKADSAQPRKNSSSAPTKPRQKNSQTLASRKNTRPIAFLVVLFHKASSSFGSGQLKFDADIIRPDLPARERLCFFSQHPNRHTAPPSGTASLHRDHYGGCR
jgi:hypothetical protein